MQTRLLYFFAAIFLPLGITAQPAPDRWPPQTRTITVTGNGEASAPPDQAVVRLGASVQTGDAATSHARVSEIVQKALDAIEKLGVPKKSLRTSGLNLQPIYASDRPNTGEPSRLAGFRASNVLQVTLEDTKLVGKVLDAGVAAGANEVQGITFGLKNDLSQRNKALVAASEEARAKAQTIARALDLELGPIREVTEGGVHVVPMQNEYFAGAARMMATAGSRTPVEPGEVRVQANVTVHYEISTARR